MILCLSAKKKGKDLAVQVMWPEGSTNNRTTSNVTGDNLDAILSKITRGVIDDNCPEGINCLGESMTGAVDKVLSLLAARLGKTGSIDYNSVQKSEITQQKLQIKLDDNLSKPKDEEDKQEVSDTVKNENKKEPKKNSYSNMTEMKIENLNPTENFDASNESDEEIEQNSEENGPTTNDVEYIVIGGNKIVAVH